MSTSEALVERGKEASQELLEHRRPKSRALSLIAGYFNVSAVLNGLSWLAFLAFAYSHADRLAPILSRLPWRTVGMIATVAMQLRVGQLLHRRSREGGIWAIGTLAPSLMSGLMHQSTALTNYSLGISILGLGLIALVWKELE